MKAALPVVMCLFVLSACGGSRARPGTPVTLRPGPITLQNTVPYSPGNSIANNIKEECDLNQQPATFVKEYAVEEGLDIRGVDFLDTKGPGMS